MTLSHPLPISATLERSDASRASLTVKRVLDVAVAAGALVLLAPVLLLIALAVRIQSPGPALFFQERVGAGGRRFRVVKFRTMIPQAEEALRANAALLARYEASNFKLRSWEDPRITSFGRILRALSLDELPQLWNVLKGDMSLVGARPVPVQHFEALNGGQRDYLSMRPGITGLWQVSGRSDISMEETNAMYVRGWSLWLDLRILARTIPAVLSRRGAY
jgi:lipopolysaccharide/colanic/teichoic acid biosynthesis glycosyltransferase